MILLCSGTYRGTRTVGFQFEAGQLRGVSLYFARFPSHGGKIWILRKCRKKIQKAYPIRNFTILIFAVSDRFNIPDGSKDMGVPNWLFTLLHHDISQMFGPYICQTVKNMELIMVSNFILSKISDRISILNLFSVWSENAHFATMGEEEMH